MKRLLLILTLAIIPFMMIAQKNYDPRTNGNILFEVVPPKANIKDKIKVWNRSPYTIVQVVVCEVVGNDLKPLGTSTNIKPGKTGEIASFKMNSLKYLKGKTIAIKAKGLKKVIGNQSSTEVTTPFGDVGVSHEEYKEESSNSLTSEDVTYEFEAKLFEDKHDLYIELYATSNRSVMDF